MILWGCQKDQLSRMSRPIFDLSCNTKPAAMREALTRVLARYPCNKQCVDAANGRAEGLQGGHRSTTGLEGVTTEMRPLY